MAGDRILRDGNQKHVGHNNHVPNLIDLEDRVTLLEDNGGGDANRTVDELEVRVKTLEGTAADHETRITSAESDVAGTLLHVNVCELSGADPGFPVGGGANPQGGANI